MRTLVTFSSHLLTTRDPFPYLLWRKWMKRSSVLQSTRWRKVHSCWTESTEIASERSRIFSVRLIGTPKFRSLPRRTTLRLVDNNEIKQRSKEAGAVCVLDWYFKIRTNVLTNEKAQPANPLPLRTHTHKHAHTHIHTQPPIPPSPATGGSCGQETTGHACIIMTYLGEEVREGGDVFTLN